MKKIAISLIALAFTAPAIAQDVTPFAELDVDASGGLLYEELVVAMPDLTVDQFAEIDTDSSGDVSEEEYVAYVGMMTKAE